MLSGFPTLPRVASRNARCAAARIPSVSVDHYENFPVASMLCPPRLRPPIVAIYRFARTADDMADEGEAPATQRLAELAAFRLALQAVCTAQTSVIASAAELEAKPVVQGSAWPQIFGPLADQMKIWSLPAAPLNQLLDAFEQDVRNPRYANRAELLAYCALSANPVGRLLLHLWGLHDALAQHQSDCICSALQLINFWQDLSVDLPRSRCYVPQSDFTAHGLNAVGLLAQPNAENSRALVRSLCEWARSLMLEGAPLPLRVPGRAGLELRLVVQGGLRILEKIAAMNHSSAQRRPKLTVADVPLLLWRGMRAR